MISWNGRGGIRTHAGGCPHDFQSCALSHSATRPRDAWTVAVARRIPASFGQKRREWDSNPRGPMDQRLSRAPLLAAQPSLRSSPAWVRTRTLLIQSQTCCQLHHGAAVRTETRRATGRTRTDDPVITSDVLYQLSYGGVSRPCPPARSGSGAEGSRTPDLSIANAALSQLSYGPSRHGRDRTRTCDLHDVNVAL